MSICIWHMHMHTLVSLHLTSRSYDTPHTQTFLPHYWKFVHTSQITNELEYSCGRGHRSIFNCTDTPEVWRSATDHWSENMRSWYVWKSWKTKSLIRTLDATLWLDIFIVSNGAAFTSRYSSIINHGLYRSNVHYAIQDGCWRLRRRFVRRSATSMVGTIVRPFVVKTHCSTGKTFNDCATHTIRPSCKIVWLLGRLCDWLWFMISPCIVSWVMTDDCLYLCVLLSVGKQHDLSELSFGEVFHHCCDVAIVADITSNHRLKWILVQPSLVARSAAHSDDNSSSPKFSARTTALVLLRGWR